MNIEARLRRLEAEAGCNGNEIVVELVNPRPGAAPSEYRSGNVVVREVTREASCPP